MENGHICVATFLDVVNCCARLAISFTASHNMIQKCCKIFSDEMVRAFDQAFKTQRDKAFCRYHVTSHRPCVVNSLSFEETKMAACHMNENLFCGIVYIFTLQTFTDTSETVLNIQVLLKILGEILRYQMKLKKHLAFRSR